MSFNTLRDGFVRNVSLHPDACALKVGDRVWTYAEADYVARLWAARLLDATGGTCRRVAVFASRSEVAYLGVLASLYAGAAYVPLNAKFPVERTRAMLMQAEVDAVFVDAGSARQLDEILAGCVRPPALLAPTLELAGTAFSAHEMAAGAPLAELVEGTPDDLAYLLFTSGSSGTPKGVPIAHRNVRAFLDVNRARYQLTPEDRLSQTFDLTFDLSVFDLFMAWDAGACVCAMQEIELLAPFKYIARNHITSWFSVPSLGVLLQKKNLLKPGSMPSLRWSLFCGEALTRTTAEAWQAAAPHSVVENLYGPTELTIACAVHRWDPEHSPSQCEGDVVPIGRLYDGLEGVVVGPDRAPVEPGQVGELCVAGPQTFAGYWRAPHLTAERIFTREDVNGASRSFYRTGDLVRQSAGGEYAFLGRADTQVKIGGFRIELGEVEAVFRRAGAVEAVALALPAEQPEFIAVVVTGDAELDALEAYARRQLPRYMVPASLRRVAEMPLNANGKVDRRALRDWVLRLMETQLPGGGRVATDGILHLARTTRPMRRRG